MSINLCTVFLVHHRGLKQVSRLGCFGMKRKKNPFCHNDSAIVTFEEQC